MIHQEPSASVPTDTSQGCIANISLRERRKRLVFGIVTFSISLAILAALIFAGAARGWRLALLPLFWAAGVGFFQWRDETWVYLAARGSRLVSNRMEQITEPSELARVRRQARRIQVKSLLAAVAMTLMLLALP